MKEKNEFESESSTCSERELESRFSNPCENVAEIRAKELAVRHNRDPATRENDNDLLLTLQRAEKRRSVCFLKVCRFGFTSS